MFNPIAEALAEGRIRIQIDSSRDKDGNFVASWQDQDGKTASHTDSSEAEAHRRCMDKVKDGLLNGQYRYQR